MVLTFPVLAVFDSPQKRTLFTVPCLAASPTNCGYTSKRQLCLPLYTTVVFSAWMREQAGGTVEAGWGWWKQVRRLWQVGGQGKFSCERWGINWGNLPKFGVLALMRTTNIFYIFYRQRLEVCCGTSSRGRDCVSPVKNRVILSLKTPWESYLTDHTSLHEGEGRLREGFQAVPGWKIIHCFVALQIISLLNDIFGRCFSVSHPTYRCVRHLELRVTYWPHGEGENGIGALGDCSQPRVRPISNSWRRAELICLFNCFIIAAGYPFCSFIIALFFYCYAYN